MKIERSDDEIVSEIITQLLSTQNIRQEVFAFILKNKEWLNDLNLKTLLSFQEKYANSLESILFLIFLAEVSKVIKNKHIRIFVLHLSQNEDNLPIAEFIQQEVPFFNDEVFLEKSFHQSLPILYLYIQETFSVIFESRYKLAKFSETIGLADIGSNSFREDLTVDEKHELKHAMFDMTKELYRSIAPIYHYLVKTQINTFDALNYQTGLDNQRLIEAIEFYLHYDKQEAFLFLERLKSKVFMENLSLANETSSTDLNRLKKRVFDLQQEAYEQEEIFDFIQTLYHAKLELELELLETKSPVNSTITLDFYELKHIL